MHAELSDRLITAQRWYLFAFFSAVLLLDVNEDDIASDLDDTPPWDHVFKIASEKPAQAAGTRDDDGKHAAGAAVDLQIRDTAKGTAGANIDDLLLPQCTQTDGLRLFTATAVHRIEFFTQGTASFPLQIYFAHYDTRIAPHFMLPQFCKHSKTAYLLRKSLLSHVWRVLMCFFHYDTRIAPHFMLPQF